jgi:hypothetical protein
LTCASSSGGETARATRPRFILESRKPPQVKATSPSADRLGAHPQPPGDLGVAVTLGREQHQLRSQHLSMRARITRSTMPKLHPLRLLEDDLLSAWTRHRPPDSPPEL